jgi:voltage-gated potassium channel
MAKPRSVIAAALEEGESRNAVNVSSKIFFVIVILASVLTAVFETADDIAATHDRLLKGIEHFAMALFTAEYALRLWTAPELAPDGLLHLSKSRASYAISIFGIIDLLAILPFFVGLALPIDADWLRVLRLLRALKLARYVPALGLFAAVIRNERRPLLAALMVMLVLLLLNSAIMFALEREAQPKSFASIPHVMWWTIVTMASVGYGDMTPLTLREKYLAVS